MALWASYGPDHFVSRAFSMSLPRRGKAEPIAAALGRLTARTVEVTFAKADVLEFHRDHQMYEWTKATPIAIGVEFEATDRLSVRTQPG